MKEPIYALDELKRSFYLNQAVRENLHILLEDLIGANIIPEEKAESWRHLARKGFEEFSLQTLIPLRKSQGKELRTVEELSETAEQISRQFLEMVPKEIQKPLEERTQQDYCFYQRCGFGKFWNEVPLPEIVEILMNRFCQLVGEEQGGAFAVSIYDMSDAAIVFSSEEQVDRLMERYDLEPCEKMRMQNGMWFCE